MSGGSVEVGLALLCPGGGRALRGMGIVPSPVPGNVDDHCSGLDRLDEIEVRHWALPETPGKAPRTAQEPRKHRQAAFGPSAARWSRPMVGLLLSLLVAEKSGFQPVDAGELSWWGREHWV